MSKETHKPEIQVITCDNQCTSKEDKETQKKAVQTESSTPVLGKKATSFFEADISSISRYRPSTSSGNSSMNKAASLSTLDDIVKHGASRSKFATRQKNQKSDVDKHSRKLEDLKSRYVQMYALCQLQENKNKNQKSQLEAILDQLQNRIAEDRSVLEKTRQQIQQVKINCERERIHRLQSVVFQQVLDKLEASNCDASLKETTELLEYYKDKVPVKDIEVPEDGLEQLEKNMKTVIESVKELSSKHNFEIYNQIGKANLSLRNCEEVAKRCKEKLADVEWLKLQETSLKISYGDEV